MKILIAEDEAIIAESLYQVLLQLGYQPLEPVSSSDEAIALLKTMVPELAILDIHMGKKFSGFDVAAILQQKNIPFIFLTALYDKETLGLAKAYNPSSYLVKPFTKENLFTTIELTISQYRMQKGAPDHADLQVFIKTGNQNLLIKPIEITYLESQGKYVSITLESGKKHLVRTSLTDVMEQLQLPSLVQVHKSFIVNTAYITALKYDEVFIGQRAVIPIGRAYKDGIKNRLSHIKEI
jgi:DNA-binding LytR/AlgR family response regulator